MDKGSICSKSHFKSFSTVGNTLKICWKNNGKIKLIFTAIGIFLSFVCVGIFQEKIMRGCYGDESDKSGKCKHGDRFEFAVTLVLVKTFFGLLIVLGMINYMNFF